MFFGRTHVSFFFGAKEDAILWRVEESTKISRRTLGTEIHERSNTVLRLLRVEGLYPFSYTMIQVLHTVDLNQRIDFLEKTIATK